MRKEQERLQSAIEPKSQSHDSGNVAWFKQVVLDVVSLADKLDFESVDIQLARTAVERI